MKNLKNLEAKLHTEQFNIGLNPSIRSFDVQFVSASGKESSVVIVRGGKFKENKDFQKLANNAEVGGKILVRNAIIEIGEMTQEPLPLVYDIVK